MRTHSSVSHSYLSLYHKHHAVDPQTYFDVTDKCRYRLQVADASIARLIQFDGSNNILDVVHHPPVVHGRAAGFTQVQLIAPISKELIGAAPLQVTAEQTSIRELHARVTSGVNVSLALQRPTLDGADAVAVAQVRLRRMFVRKYSDGALGLVVTYADGHRSPLAWTDSRQYSVTVESQDADAVVVKEKVPSVYGVFALDDRTWGTHVDVQLRQADECVSPLGIPLAHTAVNIEVHFHRSPPMANMADVGE